MNYRKSSRRPRQTKSKSSLGSTLKKAFNAYTSIGSGTKRAVGTGLRRRSTMKTATKRRK